MAEETEDPYVAAIEARIAAAGLVGVGVVRGEDHIASVTSENDVADQIEARIKENGSVGVGVNRPTPPKDGSVVNAPKAQDEKAEGVQEHHHPETEAQALSLADLRAAAGRGEVLAADVRAPGVQISPIVSTPVVSTPDALPTVAVDDETAEAPVNESPKRGRPKKS